MHNRAQPGLSQVVHQKSHAISTLNNLHNLHDPETAADMENRGSIAALADRLRAEADAQQLLSVSESRITTHIPPPPSSNPDTGHSRGLCGVVQVVHPQKTAIFPDTGKAVTGCAPVVQVVHPQKTAVFGPEPWRSGAQRLQEMEPLDGFTAERWRRVQEDAAALLERWGEELQRLGWGVLDVFGISSAAPGAAVHCYGLAICLNGAAMVEVAEHVARLVTTSGTRQSYTRRPVLSVVPVWTVG